MNGLLLLLLYCVLLFIPGCTSADTGKQEDVAPSAFQTTSRHDLTGAASSMSESRSSMSTDSPTVFQPSRSSPSPGPQLTTTTTSTTPNEMLYRKECVPVLMVTGGLIIACAILLISTLLLTWKVCQLSSRLKTLGSNGDLISNSDYWMGTAKRNKSKPETDAKETSVLMADLSQTPQEMNNGTAKEDGGKANEDGQKGEEKEVGDPANAEEASAAPVTENSSSSKPQEDSASSQSIKAAAASSSEGTEQPKDVL